MSHAGKTVTVLTENDNFRLVIDGDTVGVVPRTTSRETRRYKAYATRNHQAHPAPAPKEATHA